MRKIEVRIRDSHIAAAKRGDLYANPAGIAMQDVFTGRGLFWFGSEDRKKKIVWDRACSHVFRRDGSNDSNWKMVYRLSVEGAKIARLYHPPGRGEIGFFFFHKKKKVPRHKET